MFWTEIFLHSTRILYTYNAQKKKKSVAKLDIDGILIFDIENNEKSTASVIIKMCIQNKSFLYATADFDVCHGQTNIILFFAPNKIKLKNKTPSPTTSLNFYFSL